MEILKLEEEAPINTYKERKNKRKAFIENIFMLFRKLLFLIFIYSNILK